MADGSSSSGWRYNIELLYFFYFLTLFVGGIGIQAFYLQKICSPDGPPGADFVCTDPGKSAEAAAVESYRSLLRDCASGVVVLLAGVWRTRTKQTRPLIYISLSGQILAMGAILYGYFYWSLSAYVVASLEGGVIALTGGAKLAMLATSCYISETTPPERMTSRMVVIMVVSTGGVSLATAISGYSSTIGYHYFFSAIMVMFGLCGVLTKLLIKETKIQETDGMKQSTLDKIKAALKPGSNKAQIWVLLVASSICFIPFVGEEGCYLNFLQRRFGFTVKEAGLYSSYKSALGSVGSLVMGVVLSRCLKISDSVLGNIALLSAISMCFFNAFVTSQTIIYIVAAWEWCKPMSIAVFKSMMSQLCNADEAGIYFSIQIILDSLLPLAIVPLYPYVYTKTVSTQPGIFYLLSAGIYAVTLMLIWVTIILNWRSSKGKDVDAEKVVNNIDLPIETKCDKLEKDSNGKLF